MKETTKAGKRGIHWTLTEVLEDLDFADDIVLLASRYVDIQNAQVGGCNVGYKNVMGRFADCTMTGNGEMFISMCSLKSFF